MEQTQSSDPQGENDLELIELSVVLVADSNNPSIINPDFLQYNRIVDASYEVQDSPISTPAFSRVAYKNGITVTSDPARVLFQQTKELTRAKVASPGIAKRYLQCVPHVPYRAIGINPKGFRRILGQEPNVIATMLRDKGSWMSFQDVNPDVRLKAIYRYYGRVIFLDVMSTQRTENDQKSARGYVSRQCPPRFGRNEYTVAYPQFTIHSGFMGERPGRFSELDREIL